MNQELIKYIKTDIFPLYDRNDWAHQSWHVKEVVKRSLSLASRYSVDLNMVYVIAAFHDLGCFISRENHEEISAHFMEQDLFIRKTFRNEEIKIMKEAIIDHRGSLEYEPRTIYGKIIASADRFVTIDGIMRSTHSYTLQNHPNMDWVEMVDRSYQYIKIKYGNGGYAKSYVQNPEFDHFLEEVDNYLSDYSLFNKKLKQVDRKLRKIYKI